MPWRQLAIVSETGRLLEAVVETTQLCEQCRHPVPLRIVPLVTATQTLKMARHPISAYHLKIGRGVLQQCEQSQKCHVTRRVQVL